MGETALKNLPPMAKAFFREHKLATKVSEIPTTKILQFVPFEQVPDPFLWIEVRCIARKTFEMQPLSCP